MKLSGWIIIGVLSLLLIFFAYRLISDALWNRKLNDFQRRQRLHVFKRPFLYWLKRGSGLVISASLGAVLIGSGLFFLPIIEEPFTYLNAQAVGSEEAFLELLQLEEVTYGDGWFSVFPIGDMDLRLENAMTGAPEADSRDFIDTNVQVEGVMEADIIKTDGYTIYYASRYQNKVRVVDILSDGKLDIRADIDLGNLYTDSLYLTETQLIIIGYVYEYFYVTPFEDDFSFFRGYASYTGSVQVYDRDTLELTYELKTNTNFYEHRLIGDALYLISNKYITKNDLVPTYVETRNNHVDEFALSYDDIYYFDSIPAQYMTVVAVIDLVDYTMNSEAFLGYVNQIYASENAIYTTSIVYRHSEQSGWLNWGYTNAYTHIVKYNIDSENKTFRYAANGQVKGYVNDPYWMDEYNDYFRIVTTETTWHNSIQQKDNRLFILKENPNEQVFTEVGSVLSGIGKPLEDIKSVRFNKEIVNIVTFRTIDPLYTIDLSDPENPVILPDPIEEPGYNTYMHVWNEDYYLIGLGLDEQNQVKLSAYDTSENNPNTGLPLETFNFPRIGDFGSTVFSYSEALYNPKALMVDVEKGIFAFPVNSHRYVLDPVDGYYRSHYTSQYYVFFIDFNAEQIISDPIIITHREQTYYSGIDRGVYVSGNNFTMIYTLSFSEVVAYNLLTNQVDQVYLFEGMDWYNPYTR